MKMKRVFIATLLLLLLALRVEDIAAIGGQKPHTAEGYAGPALVWPFATGHNWKVTYGYNTVYHGGDDISLGDAGDKFTFDLVRADGTYSAGQTVYAAQDGRMWLDFIIRVKDANGSLTNYYVYYGHMTPYTNIRPGVDVTKGQPLGTIDSQAHLHFGISRWNSPGAPTGFPSNSGWIPVYFKNICGQEYPFNGGVNEYVGTVITPCTLDSTTPPDTSISSGPSGIIGTGSATFTWTGTDDQTSPANLNYSYRLDGYSNWSSWASNTSASYSSLPDRSYTFSVKARDQSGNEDPSPATRTFTVDASPPNAPTITIGGAGCADIQNNDWQHTCYDPAFTWSATDVGGSGVKGYFYCWSKSPSCRPPDDTWSWTTGTSFDPPAIASPGGAASYYLNVKARDNLDHDSSASTRGVRYDGAPPAAALQINNGAPTANQVNVTLNLSASDTGSGVAEACVANSADACTNWQPYADAIPWALPALDRATHTVYAWVRDAAGNTSAAASDDVYLDLYPVAPHSDTYRICLDVVDVGGSVNLTSTTYSLDSAIGQPWGTGGIENEGTSFAGWSGFLADVTACRPITYAVTDNYTLTHSVIASGGSLRGNTTYRLGDTIGQTAASSATVLSSASYRLASGFWAQVSGSVPPTSTQPTPFPGLPPTNTPTPTPTPQPAAFGLSIDNGALYTNDPNTTVRVWAPNVTHLRLSNDGGYSEEGWQPYQVTSTWVISTYGNTVMPRYVYGWFKDAQGGVYGPYFDDIVYDPTPPEGQVTILGGETVSVTLWLEAWDDNSGVAEMRISEDPASLTGAAQIGATDTVAWQPYANLAEWILTADKVYAQFRDAAGNVSPIYSSDGKVYSPGAERLYLPLVLRQHQ